MSRREIDQERVSEERQFIEARKAAVTLARWEHREDPEYIELEDGIKAAHEGVQKASDKLKEAKNGVDGAEALKDQWLEQFVPEALRKPEKQ